MWISLFIILMVPLDSVADLLGYKVGICYADDMDKVHRGFYDQVCVKYLKRLSSRSSYVTGPGANDRVLV